MATDSSQPVSGAMQDVEYAGFWARFAALLVDSAILVIILLGVAIAIATVLPGEAAVLIGQVVIFMVYLLYWPVMESSARQATFGKSLVGIKVTDLKGGRLSFARAFLRNLAKIVSAIPADIGFLLAAFTRRKQALHDILTNCLVVRAGPSHFLKALAAGVGGLVIAAVGAGAYVYYVVIPQFKSEVTGGMQEARKGAPAAKSARATPPTKAPSSTAATAKASAPAASKQAGAEPDFDALAGPALTGLEKPGTTRAGPAILELSTVFPTSVWIKVHLPPIKDLDIAPAPEITVTSVLDASGKNYYNAASTFEKGMFLHASLSSDSTSVPHLSGRRTVQTTPGLKEQALQKVEGQLRVAIPVEAKPVAFEAGDAGNEKPVHAAAVTLKSLSGAGAVLHYRGASRNMLGVRGYGKDGAPVAIESRQLPSDNQAVDMDLAVKFKGPVSKVEAIVAAGIVERQFPFSLARGAVAGPPSTAAAKPSSPTPGTQASAAAKSVAATPPPVQAAKADKPVAATPAAAQKMAKADEPAAAKPATARVAKKDGGAPARRPRVSPPAAPSAPATAVASAPAAEGTVITPKFNDVMTAVMYNDEDTVTQLLDLGWWVDKPSSTGLTPLMVAVMNRNVRMVYVLLARGANPNAQAPGGVTALGLARDRKDTVTATLLEQRGAR